MRVLIVSQYFPPEPFRVGDLSRGLLERGHEVTVLTGFPNYPKGTLYPGYRMRLVQREDYYGVRVIRVPLYPNTSYSLVRRGLNYASYAVSASLLGPWLTGPIDRVLVFQLSPVTIGIPGVVMKTVRRAPMAFWIQDIWPDSLVDSGVVGDSFLVRRIGDLTAFLYKHSDRILVQSPGFIPKVMERGVPREKIAYLPNWAEDFYRKVEPDPEFARREGMDGQFNVVFAGNFGAAQGLDTVLAAADRLRHYHDIRFILLGDGAMSAELRAQAEKLGLDNVVFKGRKPAELMPHYFALADVLLVHLRRTPLFAVTIPSKIQSYLACARPIIAALEGSGAEVILEANAGLTCRPEDPEALADSIVAMYRSSPADREAMGRNAREYYEHHFARDLILDKLEHLLMGMEPSQRLS